MTVALLGGIGLFLLGMLLLTDGLKAFAGDALRRALLRFTRRPVSAFASGALVTALVQSSSATTLATIGFVSAGLLTFTQALGVVFGASLGTTSTGWLVSVLGLKFSISKLALPMIAGGAAVRLFGRGRWRDMGMAIAGFGLIFVGIEYLQAGMAHLTERFDPGSFPSEGFWAHFLLMFIGLAMTVVMQSSSAAVATTMAALHTGTIGFEQAASLVIGQAVGTTVTALVASLGASAAAKRTAVAHVTFNLATGVIALVLLPVFIGVVDRLDLHGEATPGAVSLAAFHTAFIGLGVIIFLPLIGPFARLIERIVPERKAVFTRYLDDSLLSVPAVALEAVRQAARELAIGAADVAERLLSAPGSAAVGGRRAELVAAAEECERYLAAIPAQSGDPKMAKLRVALLHAMDHLSRLIGTLGNAGLAGKQAADPAWQEASRLAGRALVLWRQVLREEEPEAGRLREELEQAAKSLAEWRREQRKLLLENTAAAGRAPAVTLELLDEIRSMDKVTYHGWRLAHYLGGEAAREEGAATTVAAGAREP